MRHRLTTLLKRPAIRDVGLLMSGAIGARVLRIVTIPIITRLFEPALFGQVALLLAVAHTLNMASSLCYEEAIILPRTDAEARRVSRLSWGVLILTTGIFTLIGALLPRAWLPEWIIALHGWWLIVAALVLLYGAGNIVKAWALRRKAYAKVAQGEFAEAGIAAGGRIGWALALGSSFAGLLIATLISLITRVALVARGAQQASPTAAQQEPEEIDYPTTRAGMFAAARRYATFPLFDLPSRLMRGMSDRIPPLLLGAMFGPAAVGFFSAASRLIYNPVYTLTQSVRKVVVQRAAVRRSNGQALLPSILLATGGLAALGAGPFALLHVYGDPALAILLGQDWAVAGLYAEAIAIWGFTIFVLGPSTAVYQVLEQQRVLLLIAGVRMALFVAVTVMIVRAESIESLRAVQQLAAAGTVSNLLQLIVGLWLVWRYDHPRSARRSAEPRV